MKYETLWRRLTGIYATDEARAIVRLVLDDRFGLSLTDIVCGKVEELSPTACETLEANITGGRFFCDIADVTKEPSPCDIPSFQVIIKIPGALRHRGIGI